MAYMLWHQSRDNWRRRLHFDSSESSTYRTSTLRTPANQLRDRKNRVMLIELALQILRLNVYVSGRSLDRPGRIAQLRFKPPTVLGAGSDRLVEWSTCCRDDLADTGQQGTCRTSMVCIWAAPSVLLHSRETSRHTLHWCLSRAYLVVD